MGFLDSTVPVFNSSWLNQSDCPIADFIAPEKILSNHIVHVSLVFFLSTLSAFAILTNAIVLIALVRSRITCRLRGLSSSRGDSKNTVMLMAAMASADFALGVIVLPQSLAEMTEDPDVGNPSELSKIRGSLNVFWCTVSMYNMTSLAMDRYIAACWPFLYRSMSARSQYVLFGIYIAAPLIISTITLMTGFRLLSLYRDNTCGHLALYTQDMPLFIFNVSVSIYIPMSAMLVLYYKVFRQINRMNKISPVSNSRTDAPEYPCFQQTSDYRRSYGQTGVNCEGKSTAETQFKPAADSSTTTLLSVISNTNLTVATFVHSNWQATLGGWATTTSPGVIANTNLITSGHSNRQLTLSGIAVVNTSAPEEVTTKNDEMARKISARGAVKTTTQKQTSARIKAERTLAVVVLCFIVCWLPMSVATTVSFFRVTPLPTWAIALVTWMGYGNSALNPVLFCCHREVWQCVKSLLHIK